MSVFSSIRERRLWISVFVVVLAIYSTLGLAAKLVGQIDQGLLAIAFLVCLLLVGVTILTQGLKVRPGGMEAGIVVGVGVVYVLLGIRMAVPERSHLMEYGILAVLMYEALHERSSNGRLVPVPAVVAFLVTGLIGAVDECIQSVLPGRGFEWNDILFNVLAALASILGMVGLRWARDWARSERNNKSQ